MYGPYPQCLLWQELLATAQDRQAREDLQQWEAELSDCVSQLRDEDKSAPTKTASVRDELDMVWNLLGEHDTEAALAIQAAMGKDSKISRLQTQIDAARAKEAAYQEQ